MIEKMLKATLFSFLFLIINLSVSASSVINSAHKVEIDPQLMKADNGELTNRTLPIFLKKAYEQGILVKEAADFPNPDCTDGQQLKTKGAGTLKLFAIKVSKLCTIDRNHNHVQDDYQVKFIIKESAKGFTEVKNLQVVKNSELNIKDKTQIKKEGLPQLALQASNFYYYDHTGKAHVFAILNVAKGDEVKTLHDDLAKTYQKGVVIDPKQNTYSKDYLSRTFYQVGRSMGAMHYKYMDPPGAIFGLTYVHADLHMENIFFDGYKVTFIDNESFVRSLKEKKSILIDVMRFIGFTVAHSNAYYRHSSDIPSEVWREICVRPFFQGYVQGYPTDKKNEVIKKLKETLLQLSLQQLSQIWGEGTTTQLWEKARNEYLIPVINGLS